MAAAKQKTRTSGSQPGSAKDRGEANRVVASNRRARHDYEIIESAECGIVLQGSEVKSLRAGRIALQDSYARIIDGEMWLFGVHVPPYAQANGFGAHEPDRRRKLLLHRRQIDEWMGKVPAAVADHGAPVHLLQGRSGQGRDWRWPGVAGSTTSAMPSPPGMPAARRPVRRAPRPGAARADEAGTRADPETVGWRSWIGQSARPSEQPQGVTGFDSGRRCRRSEPWSPEPR